MTYGSALAQLTSMHIQRLLYGILGVVLLVGCGKFETAQQAGSPSLNLSATSVTPPGPTIGSPPSTPSAPVIPAGPTDPIAQPLPVDANVPAYLTVMTYNIYAIPCQPDNLIAYVSDFFGVTQCPDNTWYSRRLPERLDVLLQKLNELKASNSLPDVLLLQEAFRGEFSQIDDHPLNRFLALAPYSYQVSGPPSVATNGLVSVLFSTFWEQKGVVDSGLIILSRYPIVAATTIEYGDACAGEICMSNKGALHARIRIATGKDIDIFNTHHQSFDEYEEIRKRQNRIFLSLVAKEFRTKWAIMAGDFNFLAAQPYGSYFDFMALSQSQHSGQACLMSATCTWPATARAAVAGETYDHQFVLARTGSSINPYFVTFGNWSFEGRPLSDHDFMVVGYELRSGAEFGIPY